MAEPGLFVGLLGPLLVRRDGREMHVGSGKQRLVVGALAVAGRSLSADELIDVLWGEKPPATAIGTLQTHVSRLRGLLGPGTVVEAGGGYRLQLSDDAVDSAVFASRVAAARTARDRGDRDAALRGLQTALSLWRGPALATFRYEPFAQLEIARLEALRLEVIEDRCELDVALETGSVIPDLEALVAEHPFRERLALLLMRALYRAGRQADALRAAHRLRTALREELGLDPSPDVDALERRILDHDPTLLDVVQDPLPPRPWHAIVERVEVPAPDPAAQCTQLVDQAVSLRRVGRVVDARSAAAAAVRLASALTDHRRLGAAALALAGPPEDAVLHEPLDAELLEKALSALPSDDPLTAMLRARLAVGYIDAGDTDRGRALLDAAEATASAGTNAAAELYVLRARHRTWFDPEALPQRLELSRRMHRLAQRSGDLDDQAWATRWLLIDLLEAGDLDGFDRCLDDLGAAAERLHDVFHQWGVITRRAGQRTATGPLPEADALTVEALNLAASTASEYMLAATSSLLFVLRWRQGRLQELDALVLEAASHEAAVRPLLPLHHVELGRYEEARATLRQLTRHGVREALGVDPSGITRLMELTALSQAAFIVDERDVATQLLDELARVHSTMAVVHPGMTVMAPVAEARAAALACIGKLDDAVTHAESAVRLCADTGCHAVGVRANALLAVLLRRRGEADDFGRAAVIDKHARRDADATGARAPSWHRFTEG